MVGLALLGAAWAGAVRVEAAALASEGLAWPAVSAMARAGASIEVGAHATGAVIGGFPAFAVGPELMKPLASGRVMAQASYSQLDGLRGAEATLRWDIDAAERVTFTALGGWRWGTFPGHQLGAAWVVNAYPRPWCSFSSGPQVSFSSGPQVSFSSGPQVGVLGEPDFHLVFGAEILPPALERVGLSAYVDLGIPSLYSAGIRWAPGGGTLLERDRLGVGVARSAVF